MELCNSHLSNSFKEKKVFAFEKPGIIFNLNLNESLDIKADLEQPKEYLLLQFKNTFNVYLVRENKPELVQVSPFSENLVLKALRKVVLKNIEGHQKKKIDEMIDEIFEKGQFGKADLLAQDIFGGVQNCISSQIPPNLNASALAKFASEKEPTSSIWDQLQSLLVGFAVNIGKIANQSAQRFKIKETILLTNEIRHRRFLHFIATSFASAGQISFVQSTKESSFLASFK